MFPFLLFRFMKWNQVHFADFRIILLFFRLGFSFIVLHHFASILMFRFIAPSFHRKTFFSSYFHKHFCEFISILAKIACKKLRKWRTFSLRYETIEFSYMWKGRSNQIFYFVYFFHQTPPPDLTGHAYCRSNFKFCQVFAVYSNSKFW
jgi:hypothetical protein